MKAHKRTIQPKDVLDALSEMEFEGFLPRLEAELASMFALFFLNGHRDFRANYDVLSRIY